VILLDENVIESQRLLLRSWRIRVRQLGLEVEHPGLKDDEVIPLLHWLHPVTFFTRDLGFFQRGPAHRGYCLVCLEVGESEVASFIRRVLRHPMLNTEAKRLGKVIRVSHSGLIVWSVDQRAENRLAWPS
jgi:hypothetical protein